MEDLNHPKQFSLRDMMVLTALAAILLAVASINYHSVDRERSVNGIPFIALRNFTCIWFFLCLAAFGTALRYERISGRSALLVFGWIALLLSLLNFLGPLGAL